MATFEEAIKIYIISKDDFTSVANNKLFPDNIPKTTKLPAVTYNLINSIEDEVMSGNDYWMESIYQFDVFANTKSEAVTIINIIKKIFRNLKSSNFSGYNLQGVKLFGRLPSNFNDGIYIERYEIKFYHDYIE